MRPVRIHLETVLDAPPPKVWNLLTDWERQGEWMLEASDVVVTSPIRQGVGVEAEATVRIGPIRTRDRIRVDVWDPPRRLGVAHLGWVRGRGDFRLEEWSSKTHLTWYEELSPPWSFLGAAGLRLFAPLLRRTFLRDLGVLTRLVRDGKPNR